MLSGDTWSSSIVEQKAQRPDKMMKNEYIKIFFRK